MQEGVDAQHDDTVTAGRTSSARTIFFTSVWLWAAGALILLGMMLRERAPTILGLLTLVTAGGSWLWARYALHQVVYSRTLETDRAFPGESVGMRISVVNRKFLPLAWLEIEDQIPDRLQIVERELIPSGVTGMRTLRIMTAVRWFERVTWHFHVACPARGYFTLGPVALRSGDLFGFFSGSESLPSRATLTVYPRVVPLQQIGIPPRHLFGDLRIQRQIVNDPSRTVGVRDYRPEDSFRHVHWFATARTQSLQTKVFEPTTSVQFGVFLNLDTFEHYWEGIDYERAEVAITVAASIAMEALHHRHTVGVYANGVLGGSDQPLRIRPSRSPEQAHAILSGLAKLSPIASINFPRVLRAETTRFPWGSTIVVVTALMTEAIASVLDELNRAGHGIVLVTIDDVTVPPLRGMVTYRVDSGSVDIPRAPRRYAIPIEVGTMAASTLACQYPSDFEREGFIQHARRSGYL